MKPITAKDRRLLNWLADVEHAILWELDHTTGCKCRLCYAVRKLAEEIRGEE